MHPDGIVVKVTKELAEQVVATRKYNEAHYYAHNDDKHRAIWVTQGPIRKLVGSNIEVTLSLCYGSQKIALPKYKGKQHVVIRMTQVYEGDRNPRTPHELLSAAPRNQAVGRKPQIKDSTTIKAAVPKEMAELFKVIGEGNVSEGVRLAGKLLELQIR